MDNRQKQLLKVIVETYVKSVKPVGSKSLCEKFNLSSATIRNEMAILEDLGYIEKNHISSGRIPSEKGYRYYVENLMEPEKLYQLYVLNCLLHSRNDAIFQKKIANKRGKAENPEGVKLLTFEKRKKWCECNW